MKEIKLKNIFDYDIKTQYLGELYTIKANASTAFAEDVASHWMDLFPTVEVVSESKVAEAEPEPVKVIKKK